ncbi:MAG: aminopeptidase P N-terminal domain-containing protein [Propionibacteriaceae bacterium]|jgi:Xaa-Pro aminopeptidase|nr:aminopeptidase P N-terminal domain-containing protein [Propionibacteriaceae bacterium]
MGKYPHSGEPRPDLKQVPAFIESIAKGWEDVPRPADVPPSAAEAAASHRVRLGEVLRERFGSRAAVVFSGHAPIRNNDCYYEFRADSSFLWLLGASIEFACVIVQADGTAALYLKPPARPGDIDFFGSAAYGELWVGPSAGLNEWAEALGVAVRDYAELPDALTKLSNPLVSGTVHSSEVADFGLISTPELDMELSHLKMFKDDWEIAQLQLAVDLSVGGFEAVAEAIPQAIGLERGERWLQGTFDRHARTYGNGPGYASIVGSGKHAPTLHWVRCDGPIIEQMPLLLDMGVEARSGYTADVTRTIPPTGKFSEAGKAVHDLVETAHRAGLAAAKAGANYLDFHYAAMEVLANGLHDWGLLPVSVDEALSPNGQQHRRYIVCGIGHHLGLDVHDCSKADNRMYEGNTFQPGMVFTVEPGLYFHEIDLTVPPELRGIGVRIEDDVLIQADGSQKVLSAALPITAAGLEEWTAARLRTL